MLGNYARWYTFLPPQWSTISPPLTNVVGYRISLMDGVSAPYNILPILNDNGSNRLYVPDGDATKTNLCASE